MIEEDTKTCLRSVHRADGSEEFYVNDIAINKDFFNVISKFSDKINKAIHALEQIESGEGLNGAYIGTVGMRDIAYRILMEIKD